MVTPPNTSVALLKALQRLLGRSAFAFDYRRASSTVLSYPAVIGALTDQYLFASELRDERAAYSKCERRTTELSHLFVNGGIRASRSASPSDSVLPDSSAQSS